LVIEALFPNDSRWFCHNCGGSATSAMIVDDAARDRDAGLATV